MGAGLNDSVMPKEPRKRDHFMVLETRQCQIKATWLPSAPLRTQWLCCACSKSHGWSMGRWWLTLLVQSNLQLIPAQVPDRSMKNPPHDSRPLLISSPIYCAWKITHPKQWLMEFISITQCSLLLALSSGIVYNVARHLNKLQNQVFYMTHTFI